MGIGAWKDRFLSIPWVYDSIRPLALGLFDYRRVAEFCNSTPQDRVFDLGCGTAQLLPFLEFERYLGADLDAAALRRARKYESANVAFVEGDAWDEACRELNPTLVLMIGLVHHVPDADFRKILERLRRCGNSPARFVTFETTHFPRSPVNNFLSRLDRGKYVRRPHEYEALFEDCHLEILRRQVIPTRLGFARYIGYHLR